jgi:hypothetical protein
MRLIHLLPSIFLLLIVGLERSNRTFRSTSQNGSSRDVSSHHGSILVSNIFEHSERCDEAPLRKVTWITWRFVSSVLGWATLVEDGDDFWFSLSSPRARKVLNMLRCLHISLSNVREAMVADPPSNY